MRLLVLGGTLFLSYATAAAAVARGHDVTCAARGRSGPVPAGARLVRLDRDDPDWAGLTGQRWDAVVDVARYPSWVRSAVDALAGRASLWIFVSTCSVYADDATPRQRPVDAPLLPPAGDDVDERDGRHYGESKVACEEVVRESFAHAALIARPGLVVGPGDPSGRFAYWPHRMAQSSTVLAPGSPGDSVQMVDVRDLADWLVHAAETRLEGVFNAVGAPMSRGDMLAAVAAGVGVEPTLVWVPQEFLLAHGVEPWTGGRSLPLWLPLPDYAGHMTRDVSATVDAGLVVRPLEQTAWDTLAWLQQTPGASVTGLTTRAHRELLHAWHHVDLKLT